MDLFILAKFRIERVDSVTASLKRTKLRSKTYWFWTVVKQINYKNAEGLPPEKPKKESQVSEKAGTLKRYVSTNF